MFKEDEIESYIFFQTVTFNFENLKLAEQSMLNDAEDEHINLKRSDQLYFLLLPHFIFTEY